MQVNISVEDNVLLLNTSLKQEMKHLKQLKHFLFLRFQIFTTSGDATKTCDNVEQGTDITFKMKICVNQCLKSKEDVLLNFPAYGQLRMEVIISVTVTEKLLSRLFLG